MADLEQALRKLWVLRLRNDPSETHVKFTAIAFTRLLNFVSLA